MPDKHPKQVDSIPVLEIGPEEAQMLLDGNTRNRTISKATVARYAAAMKLGHWRMVGDPIRVAKDGTLLDGQHRLRAVVLSGCTVQFAVLEGLPAETQRVMDAGQPRSAGQQLGLEGWPNGMAMAAMVRVLVNWSEGFTTTRKIDTDEVLRFVEKDRETAVTATRIGMRVYNGSRINGPSASAFAHRLIKFSQAYPDRYPVDLVDGFFDQVVSGSNLTERHPVLVLRNAAMKLYGSKDARPSQDWLYMIVRTWNAARSGEEFGKLQRPTAITTDHLIIK